VKVLPPDCARTASEAATLCRPVPINRSGQGARIGSPLALAANRLPTRK
jgi:hypothetical protein